MQIRFFITEYVDGTLEIESKHMHYAFRDDLNYDNVEQKDLYRIMAMIHAICKREGNEARFVLV